MIGRSESAGSNNSRRGTLNNCGNPHGFPAARPLCLPSLRVYQAIRVRTPFST
jgi:hypothetical protein